MKTGPEVYSSALILDLLFKENYQNVDFKKTDFLLNSALTSINSDVPNKGTALIKAWTKNIPPCLRDISGDNSWLFFYRIDNTALLWYTYETS